MKLHRFLFLLLAFSGALSAQNQKLTMTEAVNGLRSNLAVKSISQFSWLEEGKYYTQREANTYTVTPTTGGKKSVLLSLDNLNASLQADKKLQRMPSVTFTSLKSGHYSVGGDYFKISKQGDAWTIAPWFSLPDGAENVNFSKNLSTVYYTVENNLYYINNGTATSITSETNKGIVSGQSVHRQEFGISEGIFVSPDDKMVAFYKMDESMVNDYPIIDWATTPAKNNNIKYPMAGGKSHEVKLGVYNLATKATVYLQTTGDPEQYLTSVTWSPDSKSIFVGVLNRDQNHLKLNQYNAVSGALEKTLFEEKDEKYVEPQNPLTFIPGSTKDFIWQSQRSGYNHLYHYNLDKGLVGALTKGDFLVSQILGFNQKKNELYYVSTQESPLERHLYKVNMASYKIEKLSNAPGMHQGNLSPDGQFLLDTYSNKNTPRVANLLNTQKGSATELLRADNPLVSYQRPEIRDVTLKADDGTDLFGKLILPTDFDQTKKYPVIVYLYNGPHLQLITNSFPQSGNLWYEYLAQRGYIVFTMDGRGSSGRGLKFEQAVFRNLGGTEMKDQLQGVNYLKSLSFVDQDRLGVHGWSFGGFMTTNLMLTYPEVFKVGVAGGPVIDWNMYEIMYTERYMDSPSQNPEGYKNANLLNKVDHLKGKLLMIHGAQDDVVVLQHSVKFLKAAVDNGVQLDYFLYPGHQHNVLGADRVHLMQKVTDYFDLHLKGAN